MGKLGKVHTITKETWTTDTIDTDLFEKARTNCLGRTKGYLGIGTYSEKTVHATLKYYYAPDEKYHEIRIGKNIADICNCGEIYEIQSKSFHLLRSKLNAFLPNYEVTVIYPVPVSKFIRYVNPETGEILPPKKSSRKANLYTIIPELYSIKKYLGDSHLHFILCFMETEEYKMLDGYSKDKKRGGTKTDRIPLKILGEYHINSKKDYLGFLPPDDAVDYNNFTTKDLSAAYCIPLDVARILVNILSEVGIIEKTGSENRYYTYKLLKQ